MTGSYCTGIGGSYNGTGAAGTINVWGGSISSSGGYGGAGIGGGSGGAGGTVNIYGGTAKATGEYYGVRPHGEPSLCR